MSKETYLRILGWTSAVAAAYLIQPYRMVVIHGNSMSPTYHNGEIVFSTHLDRLPHDGDVVLVEHEGTTMIKRITKLQGDQQEQLLIRATGDWIDVTTERQVAMIKEGLLTSRIYTVPPGKMFVAGDNPAVSYDSRYFGLVEISTIRGIIISRT